MNLLSLSLRHISLLVVSHLFCLQAVAIAEEGPESGKNLVAIKFNWASSPLGDFTKGVSSNALGSPGLQGNLRLAFHNIVETYLNPNVPTRPISVAQVNEDVASLSPEERTCLCGNLALVVGAQRPDSIYLFRTKLICDLIHASQEPSQ